MLLAAATRVLCCTVTALPGTKATTCVENMLSAMRLRPRKEIKVGENQRPREYPLLHCILPLRQTEPPPTLGIDRGSRSHPPPPRPQVATSPMPSGGLQAVFGRDVAHPPAVAWRVVHKRLVDRLTYEEICQELQPMSIGSVHNILVRLQAWMRASAPTAPPPLGTTVSGRR